MIASFKKATVKWTVAALALTLVVGCSSLSNPIASTVNAPGQTANAATHQNQSASNPNQQKSSTSSTPATVSSGSGSNSANPSPTGTQPQHSTGSPNLAEANIAHNASTQLTTFEHFNLTPEYLTMINNALKNLKIFANMASYQFDNGVNVLVPTQVPQGSRLIKADSGAYQGTAIEVFSLYFNDFTINLSNHDEIYNTNDPEEIGTTNINGVTANWYKSTTDNGTYFLQYRTDQGKTHVMMSFDINKVSELDIEHIAKSMVPLSSIMGQSK